MAGKGWGWTPPPLLGRGHLERILWNYVSMTMAVSGIPWAASWQIPAPPTPPPQATPAVPTKGGGSRLILSVISLARTSHKNSSCVLQSQLLGTPSPPPW